MRRGRSILLQTYLKQLLSIRKQRHIKNSSSSEDDELMLNAITLPQIEPRKAIVKREWMDENRKTWKSPRQAKRGRILVLEQKRPRATKQGTGSVAPILYPSNLGWIITSQSPGHLSGAVMSHQDSRGASCHGDKWQQA